MTEDERELNKKRRWLRCDNKGERSSPSLSVGQTESTLTFTQQFQNI